MNPATKCGGCGADRNIPITATVTDCPDCGSSMLVTNYPIIVTTAPVPSFPMTIRNPKDAA